MRNVSTIFFQVLGARAFSDTLQDPASNPLWNATRPHSGGYRDRASALGNGPQNLADRVTTGVDYFVAIQRAKVSRLQRHWDPVDRQRSTRPRTATQEGKSSRLDSCSYPSCAQLQQYRPRLIFLGSSSFLELCVRRRRLARPWVLIGA